MDDLFCRCKNQPRPTSEETKTANGSNRTQPTEICERKHIQAPAEEQNPREEQPARATTDGSVERKYQKRNCMYELVKYRLVPHIKHSPRLKRRSKTMRPERAKCHCCETKQRCDPK